VLTSSTRLVALIGDPVVHSLSPRMQNAAFAARGFDWGYVALAVPAERLAEAVRGLGALGFAGANVTAPHKLAVAQLLAAGVPSVNTLVVGDGQLGAHSTDAAILGARGLKPQAPCVLGDGGSAVAFRHALPHARTFSRRSTWPPEVAGADLVVNATAARDEVLVELHAGQILIDLPYPETATARAARRAGADVVTGLEVLVAKGAASFELWTGVAAPLGVMRAAVGLPA
jgi:shikimate dehydrogenase